MQVGGALKTIQAIAKAAKSVGHEAPQANALRLAQQRAALPVERGGLGLAADNTAMDRAKAQNYGDAFHGTQRAPDGITKFRSGLGYAGQDSAGAIWASSNADEASKYANWIRGAGNPTVYPLKIREKNPASLDDFNSVVNDLNAQNDLAWQAKYKGKSELDRNSAIDEYLNGMVATDPESALYDKRVVNALKGRGFDGVRWSTGEYVGEGASSPVTSVMFDPANIRSRFAAHDPFRKTAATAAAMGVAAPDLLAQENKDDAKKAHGGDVHMQVGGLTKLLQAIKQSKGAYGVKRLERAADEIPNLQKLYNQQALEEAFIGDNARALMTMKPLDFERFSLRLNPTDETKAHALESFVRVRGLPPMTQKEYIDSLAKIKGGFSDVPFLEINKTNPEFLPNISGHEGRHRNRAMAESGETAGLVKLLPRTSLREPLPRRSQEDYIEALKKELGPNRFVSPEGGMLLPTDLNDPIFKNFELKKILTENRPALPDIYHDGGVVHMGIGGVPAILGAAKAGAKAGAKTVTKVDDIAQAFSNKALKSTTDKLFDEILLGNPKLSVDEAMAKASKLAEDKLKWERTTKPALVEEYGPLSRASFNDSGPKRKRNTPEVVQERIRNATDFLNVPTKPWVPPKPELQAFDRAAIKDSLEGFPGVEQSAFPRDIPPRANISHVEGLYTDPVNRNLIKKQITRGLPLGGESFYGSLYPVKQAVLEAGMPAEKFDKWVHALAPASARNSIINENAVGQFLRDMNARGIPLTEENVAKEMAKFKEKYGIGLPLMPLHREGVARVVEDGINLRDHNLANIPTNYKIPTYGTQKAGDFGKSVVLDVHEAAGQSQGSRYHPYFKEEGGFGNTEYNAGEQGMLGIAKEMGIPGGMAQAGRWLGGGELTGLRSPRGDALDILEKQLAYTLKAQGKQPNLAMIRAELLNQIKTGEGTLLPWYRKQGIPDVRETGLQRKDGGSVTTLHPHLLKRLEAKMAAGGMAGGGEPGFELPLPEEYQEESALQKLRQKELALERFRQERDRLEAGLNPSSPEERDVGLDERLDNRYTLDALKQAFKQQRQKEKDQFSERGGKKDFAIDTANLFLGGFPDLVNMGFHAADYVQSKLPGRTKPVSVLDPDGEQVLKYPIAREKIFGGSEDLGEKMRAVGIKGEYDFPLSSAIASLVIPFAPKGLRMADVAGTGLRRAGTPATYTAEANSSVLGSGAGSEGWTRGVHNRLLDEVKTLNNRPVKYMEGTGTYKDNSGQLTTGPMRAFEVDNAGHIGDIPTANKPFRKEIAQLGVNFGQEGQAVTRFIPLWTNNIKDASSMLIKTKNNLTPVEILKLQEALGTTMAVAHNPKLGGVIVMPYTNVSKSQTYKELLVAQKTANEVLKNKAQIKFGISNPGKDRLYLDRASGDYEKAGAGPITPAALTLRNKLQAVEKFVFPNTKSDIPGTTVPAPMGGLQGHSRGANYPTHVQGIGIKGEYRPVNYATGEDGPRYATYAQAEAARAKMLDDWHQTLPARVR